MTNSGKFDKLSSTSVESILNICEKMFWAVQKCGQHVDLHTCCKMRASVQKSASLIPRTSPRQLVRRALHLTITLPGFLIRSPGTRLRSWIRTSPPCTGTCTARSTTSPWCTATTSRSCGTVASTSVARTGSTRILLCCAAVLPYK